MAANHAKKEEIPAAAFEQYDAFLQTAIKEYYDRGWKSRRTNFVALLLASGQTLSMAKDTLTGSEGMKRAAMGAASLVALRLALRYAVSGPLGMLLAGAGVASIIVYFLKHRQTVTSKLEIFRGLVDETHKKFDDIQVGHRDGRYQESERNLMIDGLLKRFLAEIDEG